jgi:nardilysin
MVGTNNLIFIDNPLYALFSISITLTDTGLVNIDQILEATFSYLLLLNKEGANEKLYNELKQIKENSFRFSEEMKSIIYVNKLSTKMLYFAPKDVLTGRDLYFEYDKKAIQEVIDALNQPKFNLMVITEKHEFDKKEKWFGTEYAEIGEFT